MNVAVLFEDPDTCRGDEACDVQAQRDAVMAWVQALGHEVLPVACSLDLQRVRDHLERGRVDVAVNLVEALGGTDRLVPLVPLLVEALGVPMTGCPALAIEATTNKLRAHRTMLAAGLPVPPRLDGVEGEGARYPAVGIVKAVWEHASFGLDDDAVGPIGSLAEAHAKVAAAAQRTGVEQLCEVFIPGRELNVSLLEIDGEVRVLPPAEIDFTAMDPDRPAIVGHRAKWEPDSHEWAATPRTFAFAAADAPLLERTTALARRCWDLFGLAGFARVDLRVDRSGQPWILEVNTNPCLTPDAGFIAAASQASLSGVRVMEALLQTAVDRHAGARLGPSPRD